VEVHICNPSYSGRGEFKASLGKVINTLSQKQNTNKRIMVVVQVVEYLPCKPEALGSIPGTERKRRKKKTIKKNKILSFVGK
jgi:hypothetical protein